MIAGEQTPDDDPNELAVVPGALLKRVPGRARPRSQALKLFEESIAALRRRYKPVFWPLFVPEAENIFRWRVQLECGCTHELFTRGEEDYPDKRGWLDPVRNCKLPAGEYWCPNDHGEVGRAYRDIVEWLDRRVTEFPPDPEESPYEGMNLETWAKIRQVEPHSSAFWRVRLVCGHMHDHVATDVDWKPEDGSALTTAERAAEMQRDLERMWSTKGFEGWPEEGIERDHVRKMLDLRWPRPEPEQDCYACRHAWRMTGYQRIGWLMPKKELPKQPHAHVERRKAEARLAKVEAEARRLREQLELDPDE